MMLIGILLTLGGTYLAKRHGGRAIPGIITAGLLVVLIIIQVHPPLKYLGGSALAWRLVCAAVVLGFIAWLWLCRRAAKPDGPAWQWAMFVVGLAAFFTFTLGGFIREHSKNPETVYGEIVKPELTDQEADRYLVYEKWLRPRQQMPADLARDRPDDWREYVGQARKDGHVLTDEQAERIIMYLEKHH